VPLSYLPLFVSRDDIKAAANMGFQKLEIKHLVNHGVHEHGKYGGVSILDVQAKHDSN
jgi:hypothetical protein